MRKTNSANMPNSNSNEEESIATKFLKKMNTSYRAFGTYLEEVCKKKVFCATKLFVYA